MTIIGINWTIAVPKNKYYRENLLIKKCFTVNDLKNY
jgi:hypothetical protein